MDRPDSRFNASQQRRLIASCQYVDRLLDDLERAFTNAQSGSPFSRYVDDLDPVAERLVRDFVDRLRLDLAHVLEREGLSPASRQFGLRHTLLTHLTFVDVAIEELKPHYMKGYGAVSPEAAAALNGIVEELHGAVGQLRQSLEVPAAADLMGRLQRLGTSADLGPLAAAIEITARYGLVEFRSAISAVVDTLERSGLELAVFGRVSSGKSSLINRLIERDALPVGVTPITAVPTHIRFGPRPLLRVRFADVAPRDLDPAGIAEYASEAENPGNRKRVSRLTLELPAPFLQSGVTLVDTPGLGSIMTAGAAATLAYLPRCDVAAVLVDASSVIAPDDMKTIGLLLGAGVRTRVLLSKADLVASGDLERLLTYTRDALAREFGVPVPVTPVSVAPAFESMLARWRASDLAPLLADQERQRREIATEKTEVLCIQLDARLRRIMGAGASVARNGDARAAADRALQMAAGRITDLERRFDMLPIVLPDRVPDVVGHAAELMDASHDPEAAVAEAFRDVAVREAQEAGRELDELGAALADASRQVAALMELPGLEGAPLDRWQSQREAPVPAYAGVTIPRGAVERLLKGRVARSLRARRLDQFAGAAIRSAFEDYAAVLRRWGIDAIGRLRQEWSVATDAARSVDRGGVRPGGPPDSRAVEADMERLRAGRPR